VVYLQNTYKEESNNMKIIQSVLLAAAVAVSSISAQAMEDKLVVVTSFPKDLTKQFKDAFENRHPGLQVEMLKKKTTAGIKFIQETAGNNTTDLFWASAPDAFEVLKGDGLLQKYTSDAKGIPDKVGAYPLNDPDGYYTGFAAAGYGIMWNTRYMKAKKLPEPAQWVDLTKPIYHGHVGMSAPSRSGTTHLTVETLLQGDGWEQGWGKWKQMAGNFKTVTERSFGVPDGVNSGAFGIGIVIDFFGLSSKGSGFPVEFIYPKTTTLVPANIGVIKNSPHPQAATAFIDFLLSDEGQTILLDKKIRRLPVNPDTYAKAPADFPNPFKDSSIGAAVKFDVQLSKSRYNLVNSLFDVMITYRMDDLRAATKAIQDAEAAGGNAKLIAEAKALVAAVPVSEAEAADPEFAAIFKKKRKKATDKVTGRQADVEQQWDEMVKANYARAVELANKAH
jgi:ABC-type Fe3+ transport system substrate-binding protein